MLISLLGLLVLQWSLAKANPEKTPLPFEQAILVMFAGSALLVYGLPWLIEKCPAEVRVSDRLIWRLRGDSVQRWEFKNIVSYRWIVMPEWALLMLDQESGRRAVLGTPLDVPRSDVDAFLQRCGLPKEPDGHCSDYEELAFLRSDTH